MGRFVVCRRIFQETQSLGAKIDTLKYIVVKLTLTLQHTHTLENTCLINLNKHSEQNHFRNDYLINLNKHSNKH